MKKIWLPLSMLATGVLIGMMAAPDKGSETRKKVSRQLDSAKLKWKKWKGETSQELEDLKDSLSHQIAGLEEDTRERILQMIRSAKPVKNHSREVTV